MSVRWCHFQDRKAANPGKQDISHHSSLELTGLLLTILFTEILNFVTRKRKLLNTASANQGLPQGESRHLEEIYFEGRNEHHNLTRKYLLKKGRDT